MRTRNRTSTIVCPSGEYWVDDINNPSDPNYPISQPTGPQNQYLLTESMTDEQSGMKKYGSVDHSKNEVIYYPVDLTYDYWYLDVATPNPLPGGYPRPLYRRKWQGAGMWRYYLGASPGNSWGQPTIAVPSTFDWSALSYNAVKIMRPSLNKSGLLLINFISELIEVSRRKSADVRRRQEHAQRKAGWDQQDADFLERLKPKSRERVLQRRADKAEQKRLTTPKRTFVNRLADMLRGAGSLNLLLQFSVLPTISDVKEILQRLNSLEKMINDLIKENNKIQTRHFTCPITDRITLPNDIVRANVAYSAVMPGYTTREETRWVVEPKYTATMRFTYDTSALQGLLGTIRSHLNAYGIDRLLSSVWEAIPFSFVVDWFINVSEMLAGLEDHLNDPIPLKILDFTHSVKWKHTTRIIHSEGQLGTSHVKLSGILLMERCVTRYIRRAEAPCLWAKLSVRLPSLNQVLLGGSLVSTDGRRPPRK